jgi:hypothetical protein
LNAVEIAVDVELEVQRRVVAGTSKVGRLRHLEAQLVEISTGQEHHHSFKVANSSRSLKIVLVWTDPPGKAGVSGSLSNNLDLSVVSPDGRQMYVGNVFDNGASVTGGAADAVNNAEVVLVRRPKAGQWKINVIGKSVEEAQLYALVVTGAGALGLTKMPPDAKAKASCGRGSADAKGPRIRPSAGEAGDGGGPAQNPRPEGPRAAAHPCHGGILGDGRPLGDRPWHRSLAWAAWQLPIVARGSNAAPYLSGVNFPGRARGLRPVKVTPYPDWRRCSQVRQGSADFVAEGADEIDEGHR